jgi:hypothetical protein
MTSARRRSAYALAGLAILFLAAGLWSAHIVRQDKLAFERAIALEQKSAARSHQIVPGTRIGPPTIESVVPPQRTTPGKEEAPKPDSGFDIRPSALLTLPATAAGSFIAFVLSALGSLGTVYFGWRQDRRHSYEMGLMMAALGTPAAKKVLQEGLQKPQDPDHHGA